MTAHDAAPAEEAHVDPPPLSKSVVDGFKGTLLVVLTVFAAVYFWELATRWSPIPVHDHFVSVLDWQRLNSGGSFWSIVFEQHNEHRMAPSRLLFLIDNAVFSGTQYFLYVCNFLISIGIYAVLLGAFDSRLGLSGRALRLVAAAALGLNTIQALNLDWAFQSALFLPQFLLAVSLALVWRKEAVGRFRIRLAIVLSSVAVVSLGSGIIVPVCLIAMMILRRYPPGVIFGVSVFSAIVIAAHLLTYDFRPPPDGTVETTFAYKAVYFVNFLTNIIPEPGGFAWRLLFVVASLVVMAASLVLAYLRPAYATKEQFVALGLALYCGGTAFLTALRRSGLGPMDTSLGERYTIVGMLYWTCVAVAAVSLAFAWRRRGSNREVGGAESASAAPRRLPGVGVGVSAVSVSLIALFGDWQTQFRALRTVDSWNHNADQVLILHASDMLSPSVSSRVFPDPTLVETVFDYLREESRGPYAFSGGRSPGSGSGIIRHGVAEYETCLSSIDKVDITPNDREIVVTVNGWAYSDTTDMISRLGVFEQDGLSLGTRQIMQAVDRWDVTDAFDLEETQVGFQTTFAMKSGETSARIVIEDNEADRCQLNVPLPPLHPEADFVRYEEVREVSYARSAVELLDGAAQPGVWPPIAEEVSAMCGGNLVSGTLNGSESGGTVEVAVPDGYSAATALSLLTGPNSTGVTAQGVSETGVTGEPFRVPATHHALAFLPVAQFGQGIPDTERVARVRLTDPGDGVWGVWAATCGVVQLAR